MPKDICFSTSVKIIEEYTNRLHPHRWPLAAGNCGTFSYALSNYLMDKGIRHKVVFMTTGVDFDLLEDIEQNDVVQYLYTNNSPGIHILIEINGHLVDFNGIVDEDYIYNDMNRQIDSTLQIIKIGHTCVDYDVFLQYIYKFTTWRQDWVFFYNFINSMDMSFIIPE